MDVHIETSCPHDVSRVSSCSNQPNNVCLFSSCGQYSAHYYNSSGMNVTNTCSKYIS